jgi:hypothetical protein
MYRCAHAAAVPIVSTAMTMPTRSLRFQLWSEANTVDACVRNTSATALWSQQTAYLKDLGHI